MTTLFRSTSDVISTDLDSALILIEGKTGETFQLNQTARDIWQHLPATSASLAEGLRQRYGIESKEAIRDVERALHVLESAGLVERQSDAANT